MQSQIDKESIQNEYIFFIYAFNDLSRCRCLGEYPQSIDYFDIIKYTQMFNIDDSELFCDIMQAIDDEFITELQNQREKQIKEQQKKK